MISYMNFSLRGIDEPLERRLRDRARRSSMSINATILVLLRRALGLDPRWGPYTDLDDLAGGWSEADLEQFEARTSAFEQIDEELWR